MNPLTRRKLEPGEDADFAVARSGSKSRDGADAVVVGDGKYLDAELDGLVDNSLRVADRVSIGGLPTERATVVLRVHLERALIEACAGTRPAGYDGICWHSHSCRIPVFGGGSTSLPCPAQSDSSTQY